MTGIKVLFVGFLLMVPMHAYSSTQKTYFPDGKIRSVQQYKDGVLDGVVREYHANGKVAFEQPMRNGVIQGRVRAFYDNGRLKGQVRYINNLQDGLSKEFYPNGRLKEEVVFIDGQMMSLKRFDEKGRMVLTQIGSFPSGCTAVR